MKGKKVFIVFFAIVVVSCSGSYYEKSYTIENEQWNQDNLLQFNVNVDDIYARYNVYINVRNTTDYTYSNIFFFVSVLYPDNFCAIDTVEGILADPKGKWLGSGSGRYKNNRFLYKSNIMFPQTGTFVFTIEQAMREQSLQGIATIGMEVEKINNPQ